MSVIQKCWKLNNIHLPNSQHHHCSHRTEHLNHARLSLHHREDGKRAQCSSFERGREIKYFIHFWGIFSDIFFGDICSSPSRFSFVHSRCTVTCDPLNPNWSIHRISSLHLCISLYLYSWASQIESWRSCAWKLFWPHIQIRFPCTSSFLNFFSEIFLFFSFL